MGAEAVPGAGVLGEADAGGELASEQRRLVGERVQRRARVGELPSEQVEHRVEVAHADVQHDAVETRAEPRVGRALERERDAATIERPADGRDETNGGFRVGVEVETAQPGAARAIIEHVPVQVQRARLRLEVERSHEQRDAGAGHGTAPGGVGPEVAGRGVAPVGVAGDADVAARPERVEPPAGVPALGGAVCRDHPVGEIVVAHAFGGGRIRDGRRGDGRAGHGEGGGRGHRGGGRDGQRQTRVGVAVDRIGQRVEQHVRVVGVGVGVDSSSIVRSFRRAPGRPPRRRPDVE